MVRWVGEAEGRTDEQTIRSQLLTLTTMARTTDKTRRVTDGANKEKAQYKQTRVDRNKEKAQYKQARDEERSQFTYCCTLDTNFQQTET